LARAQSDKKVDRNRPRRFWRRLQSANIEIMMKRLREPIRPLNCKFINRMDIEDIVLHSSDRKDTDCGKQKLKRPAPLRGGRAGAL
jgi:hypothetical protein